jgi:hypothetical protein
MGLFNKVFGMMISPKQNEENLAFEKQVRKDGVPHAAKRIAALMNEKIDSIELARQFVLEELDAARQGDIYAVNFVKTSGFSPTAYTGAIEKTRWVGEESRLEHIQLFMRCFTNKLSDMDLMTKLSIAIVDEIMKTWKLGKYAP